MNYIEDYLELFTSHIRLSRHDLSICTSLGMQCIDGKALTEKQSIIALRLLGKYKNQFISLGFSDLPTALLQPKFKQQFRTVDNIKSVFISDDVLNIKFPFNQDLVNKLRGITTSEVFIQPKWMSDDKVWTLDLNERSLSFIKTELINDGFVLSEDIVQLIDKSAEIEKHLENYIPMLVKENSKYKIVNCVYEKEYEELEEALYDSSQHGIYVYDDSVSSELEKLIMHKPLMKVFLNSDKLNFQIKSEKHKAHDLIKLVKNMNMRTSIFFDDACTVDEFKTWIDALEENEIKKEEIGVYFRKNNNTEKDAAAFNSLIKELKLNKSADDSKVKWFLLNSKFPKSLVKNQKQPEACILVKKMVSAHYSLTNILKGSLFNFWYVDHTIGEHIVDV